MARTALHIAACGVICSECAAYHAREKGAAYQRRTAQAWRRIYGLRAKPGEISCGGCLGPDEELFRTSRRCSARRCCRRQGFGSCAECPKRVCRDLEHAQAVWDGVPALAETLSHADFVRYARAYCGIRERLARARGPAGRPGRGRP